MPQEWNKLTELTAGRAFVVERVRLTETGIAIEGEFELPVVCTLSADDQVFLAAFVRSHGSIKKMEEFFGVSYPTIKNRLNKLAGKFDFVEIEAEPVAEGTLDMLDRGEISVEEALKRLKEERQ
jgi:hypothetical protein